MILSGTTHHTIPVRDTPELLQLQAAAATRTPVATAYALALDKQGGTKIWTGYMAQYRAEAGFTRGWLATGLLHATLAVASIKADLTHVATGRPHPDQEDPLVMPLRKDPHGSSYVSRDTTRAYAAASLMAALWPGRTQEFQYWAQQVGTAHVYSADSFPSDVAAGAALGTQTGLGMAHLVGMA